MGVMPVYVPALVLYLRSLCSVPYCEFTASLSELDAGNFTYLVVF